MICFTILYLFSKNVRKSKHFHCILTCVQFQMWCIFLICLHSATAMLSIKYTNHLSTVQCRQVWLYLYINLIMLFIFQLFLVVLQTEEDVLIFVWTAMTAIFIVDVGKVFNFKQKERLAEVFTITHFFRKWSGRQPIADICNSVFFVNLKKFQH